ncbi:hypothetical protein C8R42DRAFT_727292 [Lentinula raphanica]|nr:hypothetical protein C8R42DRAFT_727292 [Lentinula raphanica]
MSEGRDKMYGPKDEEHNGPGGIAIERMKHLKPIKGAKRAYAMGVSNQSQRDLESPASNSKRGGITTCKGEDLQREILAVVAEANVIGLDKVDSTLKAKMDHQAEMTNCPRIGTIKNKYWTSAQLNVASMNDGEEVENASMQYKKRDKKGNNGEKESAEKIADIGQFGGPHLDGGDHEGIPTAMKVLTRRNEHIESEYFTIFDLGFSWELEEFSTIYFSGLHYHSGAAAIPKATFDSEKMVYTRSTLIMYPSAHELEGDSQVALGFIPKDTMGGLLTLNKEMRDFDLHAYDTNEISTYGNYIADGLGLMDDQSYLNHFSRNMLMFLLYMVRQAPREQLMRIDKDRFLSSFTMRSGDKRIEADQWEAGPGWTGEDTQVGKKYIEDFTKLSQEELKQLWNTDSRSDTIYGNTWLAAQREEWQEHRKKMMTSIPICHATGEVENIDTKQHSSHRRIFRDSATRAARKNPDRDPLALRRTKEKGKEKKRKHSEYEANKKVKEMRKKDAAAWDFLVSPGCIPDPLIAVASTPDPTSLFHTRESLSPLTPLPMEVDSEDFLVEQHIDNLVDQVYLCLHLTGDDLSHVATLPQPPPKSAAEREKRIFRFISDIAQNSNQRLPFRELGESRFHVLHSSQNPYTANNLRTVSGFFSALMVRSVHHGTKFLLEHTPFYKDYEDWQKVYNIAKEKHPNDEKYFCNPAAYGQHCGPCRDPENAEGYWISANNQQYNQWLLNPKSFNDKGNFLLAVVKVLSSTGFRGIGKLTAFQIAMDYMRAGAFIATPKEFVETLIWVNAGAIKGLIRLGYLQKKEGKHDPIEVEVAFVKVLEHLRSKWDQKRGGKAASIDMIDVEHWLCKTSPKRLSRSSYYAIYK